MIYKYKPMILIVCFTRPFVGTKPSHMNVCIRTYMSIFLTCLCEDNIIHTVEQVRWYV